MVDGAPDQQAPTQEYPAYGASVPATPPVVGESSKPFGTPEGGGPSLGIPEPNYEQQFQSGASGQDLTPRPSKWDEFVGGAQKGFHDGTGVLWRLYQENQAPQGEQIQPDEANKRNPYRAVPYTTPVNENIVNMEREDGMKQQQLDEWMGRRDPTWGVRAAQMAGGLLPAFTNPLNVAATLTTGGLADAVIPETAPFIAKLAAHYLGTWADFSAIGKLQNVLDTSMGAKPKSMTEVIGENAVPAAGMTGLSVAMRAAFRRFVSSGSATPEAMESGIKQTVSEMERDNHAPDMDKQQRALADRSRPADPQLTGAYVGQRALKGPPGSTILTSPLEETPLYAATHGDGMPLVHEHGLGRGIQLTDSERAANNGVSRSTETPGQLRQTALPEGTQLLNIDQHPSDVGAQEFIKSVAQITGTPMGEVEGSLKEMIQRLGDWAGTDLGKDGHIPEDVLSLVQGRAKGLGYDGYSFQGTDSNGDPTSRQVHLFDPSGLSTSHAYLADPSKTPALPTPGTGWVSGDLRSPNDASGDGQVTNPAIDKTRDQGYSPAMEQTVREFRKNPLPFSAYDPGEIAQVVQQGKDLEQQLVELSKTSSTAKAELDSLREQDAQDKRLADIAQKIATCGAGGGT